MRRLSSVFAAVLLTSGAALAQDSESSSSSWSSDSSSSSSSSTPSDSTPTASSSDSSVSTGGSQGWSVVSAQTVGADRNFIHVQAGYPGIFGSFVHGTSNTLDVGGKFGFIYGQESGTGFIFGGFGLAPGLRAQGIVRMLLSSDDKMKMGLEIEPGIYTQFSAFSSVLFGIVAPVKFTLAFPISSAFAVHAGVDLPLLINITGLFNFAIPILLGGGLEYFINDSLSLTLRLRFGPSINISSAGAFVTFGLDTLAGVAFRI